MTPNSILIGIPKANLETFILAAVSSLQIIRRNEEWGTPWIISRLRTTFWWSRYRIIYKRRIENRDQAASPRMVVLVSRVKANHSSAWRRSALCRPTRVRAWSLIRRSWTKRAKRNRVTSASARGQGRARLASWLEIPARRRAWRDLGVSRMSRSLNSHKCQGSHLILMDNNSNCPSTTWKMATSYKKNSLRSRNPHTRWKKLPPTKTKW